MYGVSEGEQKIISMFVNVMCTVKWVGHLLFRRGIWDSSMDLATMLPLEFVCLDVCVHVIVDITL